MVRESRWRRRLGALDSVMLGAWCMEESAAGMLSVYHSPFGVPGAGVRLREVLSVSVSDASATAAGSGSGFVAGDVLGELLGACGSEIERMVCWPGDVVSRSRCSSSSSCCCCCCSLDVFDVSVALLEVMVLLLLLLDTVL